MRTGFLYCSFWAVVWRYVSHRAPLFMRSFSEKVGRINTPMSSRVSNQSASWLLVDQFCDWLRISLCISCPFPFSPSSEVAVIFHQVICAHPFSPPTLPRAFYSSTWEWRGPVPLQGTPDFPSLFHWNASQRPSWTSLWSLWSSCKHWQNQWDFHTAGWRTRCRCYW